MMSKIDILRFLNIGIPSVAARAGGIIVPFATELCQMADSTPEDNTQKKFGTFVVLCAFHMAQVSSGVFLIGIPSNILSANLALNNLTTRVDLDFTTWLVASIVPCLVSLLLVPLMIFLIWTPETKRFPDHKKFCKTGLSNLGPLGKNEFWVIVAFSVTISLWVLKTPLSHYWYINEVAAGLVGISVLLFKGILTWQECLQQSAAWNTVVWFAILMSLAQTVQPVMEILSETIGAFLKSLDMSWYWSLVFVMIFHSITRYFFASTTAHVLAMYVPVVNSLVAAGCPPKISAFAIAIIGPFLGCLTPYASACSPLYFATGMIPTSTFWVSGLLVMAVHLMVLSSFGVGWWVLLGYDQQE